MISLPNDTFVFNIKRKVHIFHTNLCISQKKNIGNNILNSNNLSLSWKQSKKTYSHKEHQVKKKLIKGKHAVHEEK